MSRPLLPDEINRLTRSYVFNVICWPRDNSRDPIFDEEGTAMEGMAERAVKLGMPYSLAGGFAERMAERRKSGGTGRTGRNGGGGGAGPESGPGIKPNGRHERPVPDVR